MATIDERVVSLKMNNKQFLSAIKESSSSMDKLKESLKMDGAANGLKRIGEIPTVSNVFFQLGMACSFL